MFCRNTITEACFCAIDAEWKPSSSRPKACLLQLACRMSNGLTTVLLLDMLKLSMRLVKGCLQTLFRRFDAVKIGFGLEGDLRAVSTAIGHEGGGCIARTHAALDLRSIRKGLQKLGAAVPFVTGQGLSGLVAATLSSPLNKSQQCSAWHCRPLTAEQLAYAANDAAVLLAIFDALVAVAPPASFPVVRGLSFPDDRAHQESDTTVAVPPQAPHAQTSGSEDGAHGPLQSVAVLSHPTRPQPSSDRKVQCKSHGLNDDVASHPLGSKELQEPSLTTTEALCEIVARQWGNTLSVDCNKFTWLYPAISTQAQAEEVATAVPGALPQYIPWKHGMSKNKRFLCDVMVQGLARQMRLFGIDTASMQQLPKGKRPQNIRTMLQKAAQEQRVVLTSDKVVPTAQSSGSVYLLKGISKKDQFAEVVQVFELSLSRDSIMSRCNQCGGSLVDKIFRANELPPGESSDSIPAAVLDECDEFWMCSQCSKIFWQGKQYHAAMEHLTRRIDSMGLAPSGSKSNPASNSEP